MSWSPILHLLQEIILALTAGGTLVLQMTSQAERFQRKLILAGLGLVGLALLGNLYRPPLSLWGEMFYLSLWSACSKLVLTILIVLTISAQPRPDRANEFFLLIVLLSGFLIVSSANLLVVVFSYLWSLMAAFFYHQNSLRSISPPQPETWLRNSIGLALLMFTGTVLYLAGTAGVNPLQLTALQFRQVQFPLLLIICGLQHLFFNNYLPQPLAELQVGGSLVDDLILPFIEVNFCAVLLYPIPGTRSMLLYIWLICYSLGIIGYTNHRLRRLANERAFIQASLPIQNALIMLAFCTADSRGLALAFYYTLTYLYSVWLLIQFPATGAYKPLRFVAWFNLAGLPLTPGFVIRWELATFYQQAGGWNFLITILIIILSLITFWNYARQFKPELLVPSPTWTGNSVGGPHLVQFLLILPLLIAGLCWEWLTQVLENLLWTIKPF